MVEEQWCRMNTEQRSEALSEVTGEFIARHWKGLSYEERLWVVERRYADLPYWFISPVRPGYLWSDYWM